LLDVQPLFATMPNGFRLIRAVFFSLLALFSTLSLGITAWFIDAASRSGVPVTATSLFILFESGALMLCILLGLAEAVLPGLRTSLIAFECAWTLIGASCQLVAAVSATVNGPVWFCQYSAEASLCASSALLVPAMWIKTMISFTYFLTFLFTVLAHRRDVPRVWSETVHSVNWFDSVAPSQRASVRKRDSYWDEDDTAKSRLGELESGYSRAVVTAPWARPVRRGVQSPFAPASTVTPSPTLIAGARKTLSPIPMSTIASPRAMFSPSRFVERFRDSRTSIGSQPLAGGGTFPPTIQDDNRPVPKPKGTEWVRANPTGAF